MSCIPMAMEAESDSRSASDQDVDAAFPTRAARVSSSLDHILMVLGTQAKAMLCRKKSPVLAATVAVVE